MSEIPGSKCQCNFNITGIPGRAKRCPKPADSVTGEAMLCLGCWENEHHKEANMVPKRLPKREAVYGAIA